MPARSVRSACSPSSASADAARFADPRAIQRRSAIALAAQLGTPADIAAAADLMVRQLAEAEIALLAVMTDAVPEGAHALATELCVRLDVALELRERIADLLAPQLPPARGRRGARRARPSRPCSSMPRRGSWWSRAARSAASGGGAGGPC